ncbi:MAG: hypothetical protein Q9228_006790 [Teloschistes exilis]
MGALDSWVPAEEGDDQELRRQESSGSVKRARERARERAAAGLPPQGRDPLEPAPLRITPNRTPPRATTPSEQNPQASSPALPTPRFQPVPSPITPPSHASTTPNRPPPSDSIGARIRSNSPVQEIPKARGPPPKRPPRPDDVPPLAQNSGQHSPKYWENNFASPTGHTTFGSPGRTGPDLSPRNASEFPIPFIPPTPLQPRRNLGPPPSARKGGANFYPQNAFVTPISEEPESRSSLASSHVMPASWADGALGYDMSSGIEEEDEESVQSPSSTIDGRETRIGGDHDESMNLVRKVSVGKPGKPALKSVKDYEGVADEVPKSASGVQFGPGAGLPTFLAPSSNNSSPAGTPREKDIEAGHLRSGTASPTSPIDPRVAKILGGLEKGGALSSTTTSTTPMTSKTGSMSEKGGKRPARLKLDAVKEQEPRGSATSLPELIRRATRLASNLDRGRTASRIGMLEMLEKEKSRHASRSASISDMLAAFPSPSLATPGKGSPRSPRFPSPRSRSHLNQDFTVTPDQSEYGRTHKGRRCCGLPIWAFILLCIILLLLIAAAIIIPVTLIVLPRQDSHSGSGAVAACRKSYPCANGGTSVLEAQSCRCVCMNGFTGASCTVPADSGCSTSKVQSVDNSNILYQNATLGTSITRLLTAGIANYSIPLDPSIILSLFSSQNLTCTAENALVTFNGKPQRRRRDSLTQSSSSSSSLEPRLLSLDELLNKRQPPTPVFRLADRADPAQAAVTSNGLVYAAPSPPTKETASVSSASSPASKPSISSSTTTTSTSTNSTNTNADSSASTIRPLTPNILDFARTIILFITQELGLATAVSVQEDLQLVFTPASMSSSSSKSQNQEEGTFNASARKVGNGIRVDWTRMTVDLGNGTLFGNRGEG